MIVEKVDFRNADAMREIAEFCAEAGLPFFHPDIKNLIAQFAIRDSDGRLAAAGRFELTHQKPFVEEIAVRADLRGKGLGSMIVESILEEAVRYGTKTIWVMAREPGFFLKLGFEEAENKELRAKLKKECLACRDFMTACNPSLMKKELAK